MSMYIFFFFYVSVLFFYFRIYVYFAAAVFLAKEPNVGKLGYCSWEIELS